MQCIKCENELSLIKGEYHDYYHCAVCFYYTYRGLETCCRNPDMKYVTLGTQLRHQCFNCGAMPGGALKQSLVPDLTKVPIHNQNLRDSSYDKSAKERSRFIEWVNKNRLSNFHKEYGNYLLSERWRLLRIKILERDKHVCQGCLIAKATQVHHVTYDRLYDECCFDLISVCEDCHNKIHNKN